jgi:hypothetical protein
MGLRPKQGDFTGATGMCQEEQPICVGSSQSPDVCDLDPPIAANSR